jgi:hypothetical protein
MHKIHCKKHVGQCKKDVKHCDKYIDQYIECLGNGIDTHVIETNIHVVMQKAL